MFLVLWVIPLCALWTGHSFILSAASSIHSFRECSQNGWKFVTHSCHANILSFGQQNCSFSQVLINQTLDLLASFSLNWSWSLEVCMCLWFMMTWGDRCSFYGLKMTLNFVKESIKNVMLRGNQRKLELTLPTSFWLQRHRKEVEATKVLSTAVAYYKGGKFCRGVSIAKWNEQPGIDLSITRLPMKRDEVVIYTSKILGCSLNDNKGDSMESRMAIWILGFCALWNLEGM